MSEVICVECGQPIVNEQPSSRRADGPVHDRCPPKGDGKDSLDGTKSPFTAPEPSNTAHNRPDASSSSTSRAGLPHDRVMKAEPGRVEVTGQPAKLTFRSVSEYYEYHPKMLALAVGVSAVSWVASIVLVGMLGIVIGAVVTVLAYFIPPWREKVRQETTESR